MSGVLITGSTGFLGKKLVNNILLNSEFELFLTEHRQRISIHFDEKFSNRINIVNTNSDNSLRNAFENNEISHVVHAATVYGRRSERKEEIIKCNILLPLKILEIGKANGLEHFVNIDTYFNKFNNNMDYLNDYTNSKRSLYRWLESFSDSICISNLVIEHMYGPGDSKDKFVSILINETKSGFKSNLKFSPGHQKRDFVFVNDVVDAINFILKLDKSRLRKLSEYQKIEIGTGIESTLIELFEIIQEKLGTFYDSPFGTTGYRENEIMQSFANTQLMADLGWRSKIDLACGIKETIKSMEK